MKSAFIRTIVFLSIICSFAFFHAQAATPVDQLVTVDTSPQNPRAHENVNIEIQSFSYDLSRAKISWYVDGALRAGAVGQTTFSFTTGDIGSATKVRYSITTAGGFNYGDTLSFSPGDVTLVAESLGYVPPFYKGKPLFSFEGVARIVAIPNLVAPNGTKYKPEDLVYTWTYGMGVDTNSSGYGKNVLVYYGDIVSRPKEITVDVTDIKGTTHAQDTITLTAEPTELHVYENNPSLGILFNKEIGDRFNLSESEISFVAEPFYFNNPGSEAKYTWEANGTTASETSKNITFRLESSNTAGKSTINVGLDNFKRILQSAAASFDIYTNESTDTSSPTLF